MCFSAEQDEDDFVAIGFPPRAPPNISGPASDTQSHAPCHLARLPQEIRDNIYSYFGLGTRISDFGHGVSFKCRHVFEARYGRLKAYRSVAQGTDWERNIDDVVDAKPLVAIMKTNRAFRKEIEHLLYGQAILVISLDED